MGTIEYMSPEQRQGKVLDCRTDLYSFGVVLYEMATGVRPVAGLTARVKPPAALGQILSKCLEADPERRYQSAAEIRAALEKVGTGGGGVRWRWAVGLAVAAPAVVFASSGSAGAVGTSKG